MLLYYFRVLFILAPHRFWGCSISFVSFSLFSLLSHLLYVISCGRISCIKEGYDYCPFCGYLVERVVGSGSATSAASRHKERLLRFDREYAKRTVVLDDQADYFTHQSLNWMGTEDDRQSALTKEQERLEQAGSHAYMKLELSV